MCVIDRGQIKMPSSIAGCGTKHYETETWENCRASTKWITFLYIPLFPIGSFRIRHISSAPNGEPFSWRVALDWKHIRNVYCIELALVGVAIGLLKCLSYSDPYSTTQQASAPSSVSTSSTELAIPSASASSPSEQEISPSPSSASTLPRAKIPAGYPSGSGYIKGYPKTATYGNSSLTVQNNINSSDFVVKIFSLTTGKAIRVFLVRDNQSFTVEKIASDRYDVRYKNLASGRISKSEAFELVETDGESTRMAMTLYKVRDGNMQTQEISEELFE
jgi:hypothetical protein